MCLAVSLYYEEVSPVARMRSQLFFGGGAIVLLMHGIRPL